MASWAYRFGLKYLCRLAPRFGFCMANLNAEHVHCFKNSLLPSVTQWLPFGSDKDYNIDDSTPECRYFLNRLTAIGAAPPEQTASAIIFKVLLVGSTTAACIYIVYKVRKLAQRYRRAVQ